MSCNIIAMLQAKTLPSLFDTFWGLYIGFGAEDKETPAVCEPKSLAIDMRCFVLYNIYIWYAILQTKGVVPFKADSKQRTDLPSRC